MTIKDYLKKAYRLDNFIEINLKELQRLKELETSLSAVNYAERVQTTHNSDAPFVNAINKVMDMEKKINEEIEELVSLKKAIEEMINCLTNDEEKAVLKQRYFNKLTWGEIACELHIGKSTARRIHDKAIEDIESYSEF